MWVHDICKTRYVYNLVFAAVHGFADFEVQKIVEDSNLTEEKFLV
jgi:hypothetical protein